MLPSLSRLYLVNADADADLDADDRVELGHARYPARSPNHTSPKFYNHAKKHSPKHIQTRTNTLSILAG